MQHWDLAIGITLHRQVCADLHDAAGITSDDGCCTAAGDLFGFLLADGSRQFWLVEVVDAS